MMREAVRYLLGLRLSFIFKQEFMWLFRLRQGFQRFLLYRLELQLSSIPISQLILALKRILQPALQLLQWLQQALKQISQQALKQISQQALIFSFPLQHILFSILKPKPSFKQESRWRLKLVLQSHYHLRFNCSSILMVKFVHFMVLGHFIKP